METLIIISIASASLATLSFIFLLKNNATLTVRSFYLDEACFALDKHDEDLYHEFYTKGFQKLPSYERMLFLYPFMWTKRQWDRWLEKKQ